MSKLIDQLSGGDRRSIGRSNCVARQVLAKPALYPQVIAGLRAADPLVRMRCADAAEKISAAHPSWLQPHKRTLLALATETKEQELRWHLAQMLPRLALSPQEKRNALAILFMYLEDRSRIVATFALQALADFSCQDRNLKRRLLPMLKHFARTGSPAMRARARKLATRFGKQMAGQH